MQFQEHLLHPMSARVPAALIGSLLAAMDRAGSWLAAVLREIHAAINIPVLREMSRMFQESLQHPGIQLLADHRVWILIVVSLIVGVLAAAGLWRMLCSGIRVDQSAFKTIGESTPRSATVVRGAMGGYFRSLASGIFEGAVLFVVVTTMTLVLLVFCKIFWFSYLASPIGRFYPIYFPQRAMLIGMVLQQDLFSFPLMLAMIAFIAGMIGGATCRLFYLSRVFYLSSGIMGRILLLALPLNLLAAAMVRPIFSHPHWGAAYAATLIPVLLSFDFCFRLANRLLPEIGMLFNGFRRNANAPVHTVILRNLNSPKTVLAFDPIAGRRTGKRYVSHDGIVSQGLILSRRGHALILYRYGRDLFFQVDNLELLLTAQMSVTRLETGRFSRRFELSRDGAVLFRLKWSTFPLWSEARGPTVAFFTAMGDMLLNREAYEKAFAVDNFQA